MGLVVFATGAVSNPSMGLVVFATGAVSSPSLPSRVSLVTEVKYWRGGDEGCPSRILVPLSEIRINNNHDRRKKIPQFVKYNSLIEQYLRVLFESYLAFKLL
jgi:hypothetical protein